MTSFIAASIKAHKIIAYNFTLFLSNILHESNMKKFVIKKESKCSSTMVGIFALYFVCVQNKNILPDMFCRILSFILFLHKKK